MQINQFALVAHQLTQAKGVVVVWALLMEYLLQFENHI
jgi:hypothetical protein